MLLYTRYTMYRYKYATQNNFLERAATVPFRLEGLPSLLPRISVNEKVKRKVPLLNISTEKIKQKPKEA